MNENIENNLEVNNVDEKYMKIALQEAKKAYDNNEVPIGCVIVYNDEIIGIGANMRVTDKNVLSHAEIIAINEACGFMGDWRLEDCTLYVTVEPCPMCAGAIVQARIKKVVFGAEIQRLVVLGLLLIYFKMIILIIKLKLKRVYVLMSVQPL